MRRRWGARVSRLNETLSRIAEQHRFTERLTVSSRHDELTRLEHTVNKMFDALDDKDRKLREREELFRTLAESVQESIIVHREDIIYVNPRAAQRARPASGRSHRPSGTGSRASGLSRVPSGSCGRSSPESTPRGSS
jgi:hypothetical protein